MKWVEIIVTDKKEFQKALGKGFYDRLEEAETPTKVTLPWATIYFPCGVSLRKLRDVCADLQGGD